MPYIDTSKPVKVTKHTRQGGRVPVTKHRRGLPRNHNPPRGRVTRGNLKKRNQDIHRIKQLGSKDWVIDPITGERVIDAMVESPPRPDKDEHVYLPNKTLEAYEELREYPSKDGYVSYEDLRKQLKSKGYDKPDEVISDFKKRGWIIEKEGRISLAESSEPTAKTKNLLNEYIDYSLDPIDRSREVSAIVLNSRTVKKKDIQYFNSERWEMTHLGNNIIFYKTGDPDFWHKHFSIFQMHDQAVASDKYKPILFVQSSGLRDPILAYTDREGNGLLIKNVKSNFQEAQNEIETLKLGRYVGAGVPEDARIIKEEGDYYIIEKLIPHHKLWDETKPQERKRVIKSTPAQAGRSIIFYQATKLRDRKGDNIMVSKRGKRADISDIDFGVVDFENVDKDLPPDADYYAKQRKPDPNDTKRMNQYNQGMQQAVNRITKIVDTGQDEEKFAETKSLKFIAEQKS